jgi:hypothetical protein
VGPWTSSLPEQRVEGPAQDAKTAVELGEPLVWLFLGGEPCQHAEHRDGRGADHLWSGGVGGLARVGGDGASDGGVHAFEVLDAEGAKLRVARDRAVAQAADLGVPRF